MKIQNIFCIVSSPFFSRKIIDIHLYISDKALYAHSRKAVLFFETTKLFISNSVEYNCEIFLLYVPGMKPLSSVLSPADGFCAH